jgi:hypothetical protein
LALTLTKPGASGRAGQTHLWLRNTHAESVSTDGAFFNQQMTLAALKVARDY